MRVLAALASALALPGFTHVATEPAGGTLLSGTFPGTERPGFVYLPPGFAPTRRYPVVYLLHGLPGSPSEYVDGTQLGPFADAQIAAGAVRPFIAVVPAAGATPGYGGEWAGAWERALVHTVVPWVDARLPTIANGAGRVIAGLSAGGYGAVDIALRHPGLFDTVESWSGYFAPLRDRPFRHARAVTLAAHDPRLLARATARRLRRDRTRFFLSTGPPHSHRIHPGATAAFAAELRRLHLVVSLRSYPTKEGQWRDQVDGGLLFAFGHG